MTPLPETTHHLTRDAASRLAAARWRQVTVMAMPALTLLQLLLVAALVHRVYSDRSVLPDVDPSIRLERPTTGEDEDYDAPTSRASRCRSPAVPPRPTPGWLP